MDGRRDSLFCNFYIKKRYFFLLDTLLYIGGNNIMKIIEADLILVKYFGEHTKDFYGEETYKKIESELLRREAKKFWENEKVIKKLDEIINTKSK